MVSPAAQLLSNAMTWKLLSINSSARAVVSHEAAECPNKRIVAGSGTPWQATSGPVMNTVRQGPMLMPPRSGSCFRIDLQSYILDAHQARLELDVRSTRRS